MRVIAGYEKKIIYPETLRISYDIALRMHKGPPLLLVVPSHWSIRINSVGWRFTPTMETEHYYEHKNTMWSKRKDVVYYGEAAIMTAPGFTEITAFWNENEFPQDGELVKEIYGSSQW